MIHQFQLHGYNIVLDVCSGAVHVVDEVAYDIIAIYENNSKDHVVNTVFAKHQSLGVTLDEVAECYDQVTELANEGKLFTPDTFEPMAGQLKQKTSGVVKALCLHIAHTCNLNCSYCFASQGKYHGERALMKAGPRFASRNRLGLPYRLQNSVCRTLPSPVGKRRKGCKEL